MTLGETQLVDHRSTSELEDGLATVRLAPRATGRLELIVRRPAPKEREVLAVGTLDLDEGLVGDSWRARGSRRTPDGAAHPDMQLNVMSARAAALIAGPVERWSLAGDQLYVDLDLSVAGLAPGDRLAIGTAVIEITAQPHLGCAKFAARFGKPALSFVNSAVGRELRLRGVNARVTQPGIVRTGDPIIRVEGVCDRDAC